MVRNMMGLLIAIGHGKLGPDEVPALIEARDRTRLPGPAPAHGLTLESVYYEHGWGGKYSHPLHLGMLCGAPGSELGGVGEEGCLVEPGALPRPNGDE